MTQNISDICDKKFERIEAEHMAEDGTVNIQLFRLGSYIFSSVVIIEYVGMETLDETIDGKLIHEYALDTAKTTFQCSINPLTIIFGLLPYKLRLKKKYG
jgi:hypothetical protein